MQMNFYRIANKNRLLSFILTSFTVSIFFLLLLCIMIFVFFTGATITATEAFLLFTNIMIVSWGFMLTICILFNLLLYATNLVAAIPFAVTIKKTISTITRLNFYHSFLIKKINSPQSATHRLSITQKKEPVYSL